MEKHLDKKIEHKEQQYHSRGSHLKMMIVCCGLPLLVLFAITILGIDIPSVEILILIACPILMVTMMSRMNKSSSNAEQQSCCQTPSSSENVQSTIDADKNNNPSCCSSEHKPIKNQASCSCGGGKSTVKQLETEENESIPAVLNSQLNTDTVTEEAR